MLAYVIKWCLFWFHCHEQDLAGDVVQNLHEYFRVIYKKVMMFSSFHIAAVLILAQCRLYFRHIADNMHIHCRSLKLISKSLKQTTEGSDSEKKDLIDLYSQCKGNMNRY